MKHSITALFALTLTAAFAIAGPSTQPASHAYPLKTDVVTGEALGDHPTVEQIDGREVHFANADNVEKFKAGGEAMQKKMDDAIIAATKDSYPLKTCVVSGDELGSDMGPPVMYVYRPTNQLVEFCCNGCPKEFKANPAKYLEKIKG